MKRAMVIVIVTTLLLGMVSFAIPVSANKPETYTLPGGSATTSPGALEVEGKVYEQTFDLSGGGTIEMDGIDLSNTVADGSPATPNKNSFKVQFGVQNAATFQGMSPRYAVFFTLTIQGVCGVDRGYPWWYTPPDGEADYYMRSYLVQTWYTGEGSCMGNGHGFNDDYSLGGTILNRQFAKWITAAYDTLDLKFEFSPNPDGTMRVEAYSRVHDTTPSPPAPSGWRAVKPAWAGVWPSQPAFDVPRGVIDWSRCRIFTLIANSGWPGNESETYSWSSITVEQRLVYLPIILKEYP